MIHFISVLYTEGCTASGTNDSERITLNIISTTLSLLFSRLTMNCAICDKHSSPSRTVIKVTLTIATKYGQATRARKPYTFISRAHAHLFLDSGVLFSVIKFIWLKTLVIIFNGKLTTT
jgi:hypothetical protein